MALKDEMAFGFTLPCRGWQPLERESMTPIAQRAEALGFQDLWVTENTLDEVYSYDPMVALSYTAAVTTTIRLGVSVLILPVHNPVHVAHQVTSLDFLSGGRAVLGVGLGRASTYESFRVPMDRRVARFNEAIDVMKALWTKPAADYHGEFYDVQQAFALKPVQKPHPPIWLGGAHPSAIRRAARVADGWMAAGGQSKATLQEAVPILHEALLKHGKDPATFPVSKRVFLSVHENPAVAREELLGWFTNVYRVPEAMHTHGFHGTPEQAREYIEEARSLGLNHLLLNPVARTEEQLEALAEVVGLA